MKRKILGFIFYFQKTEPTSGSGSGLFNIKQAGSINQIKTQIKLKLCHNEEKNSQFSFVFLYKDALSQTHLTSKYLDSDVPVHQERDLCRQSPPVATFYHYTIPKPFGKHYSEQHQQYSLHIFQRCQDVQQRHKTHLFHPRSKMGEQKFRKAKFLSTKLGGRNGE